MKKNWVTEENDSSQLLRRDKIKEPVIGAARDLVFPEKGLLSHRTVSSAPLTPIYGIVCARIFSNITFLGNRRIPGD